MLLDKIKNHFTFVVNALYSLGFKFALLLFPPLVAYGFNLFGVEDSFKSGVYQLCEYYGLWFSIPAFILCIYVSVITWLLMFKGLSESQNNNGL